jgi:hypothetical protein
MRTRSGYDDSPAGDLSRLERPVREHGVRERKGFVHEGFDASVADQRDCGRDIVPARRPVARHGPLFAEYPGRRFKNATARKIAHDHEAAGGRERLDARSKRLFRRDEIERDFGAPSVGMAADLMVPIGLIFRVRIPA